MPCKKLICMSTFIAALSLSQAYANVFYRHVPFTQSISHADTLIVDYDFNESPGIRCTSPRPGFVAGYTYKGYFRTTRLALTLINDHVPNNKQERLADKSGQLTINYDKADHAGQSYTVSCDYLETKA